MKKWIGILCLGFLLGCPAQENTENTNNHEQAHQNEESHAHNDMTTKTQDPHSHGDDEHSHESNAKHSHEEGGEEHSHGSDEHQDSAEGHDHNKAPHGGILMDKDGEHWELVVHSDHIDFFLMDGDLKTVSLQGASAELLIQGESDTRTVELLPEEENLMGKGVFDPDKETAILTLKRGDKSQMLRFGK